MSNVVAFRQRIEKSSVWIPMQMFIQWQALPYTVFWGSVGVFWRR